MVEDPRGAAPVTSPAACTPPIAATSIFVTELAGLAVHTLRVADSRATGQKHRQHHHLKGTTRKLARQIQHYDAGCSIGPVLGHARRIRRLHLHSAVPEHNSPDQGRVRRELAAIHQSQLQLILVQLIPVPCLLFRGSGTGPSGPPLKRAGLPDDAMRLAKAPSPITPLQYSSSPLPLSTWESN